MNYTELAKLVGTLVANKENIELDRLRKIRLMFIGGGVLLGAYGYKKLAELGYIKSLPDNLLGDLPKEDTVYADAELKSDGPISSAIDKLHKAVSSISEGVSSLFGGAKEKVSEQVGRTTDKQGSLESVAIPKGSGTGGSVKRFSPAELGSEYSSIPSYGSYTKEEASKVKSLLDNKEDITASRTRMHPAIEKLIQDTALKYGVDPDLAVKVAVVESGGNPNAVSSTGAIGIFQLTGATASSLGVVDRFNIADNIDGGVRLMVADRKFVGNNADPVSAYIAIQLGGPSAKYVLSQPRSTPLTSLPDRIYQAVRKNIGGKSSTVGEYIDANAEALEKKLAENRKKPTYNLAAARPETSSSSKTASSPSSSTIPQVATSPNTSVSPVESTSAKQDYTTKPKTDTAVKKTSTPGSQPVSTASASPAKPDSKPQGVWRHPSGMLIGTPS